jgi:hypothetical protein
LCLRSPFPLPELLPGVEGEAVTIRFGEREGNAAPAPGGLPEGRYTPLSDGTVAVRWRDVGTFRVRDGRDVEVEPAPGASEALIRLFLLGPVLAVLLHRRGRTVLHAGAVALPPAGWVGAGAVAFLGHTGGGKSTLVAAFQRADYRALTDDLVAFRRGGGDGSATGGEDEAYPPIHPGFPQVKITDRAAAALGIGPADLEPLPPLPTRSPRLAYRFPEGFRPDPLPLRRLYLLGKGPEVRIEPVPLGEALVGVIRHAYLSGHLPPGESAVLFRSVEGLLRRVPVRRLVYPRRMEELANVLRAVERDREGGPGVEGAALPF